MTARQCSRLSHVLGATLTPSCHHRVLVNDRSQRGFYSFPDYRSRVLSNFSFIILTATLGVLTKSLQRAFSRDYEAGAQLALHAVLRFGEQQATRSQKMGGWPTKFMSWSPSYSLRWLQSHYANLAHCHFWLSLLLICSSPTGF